MSDAWPLLLLAYPMYLLLMAGVLRLIGVPKRDVVAWALKQAERQRLTEMIRAARGLPEPDPPPRPGGGEPPAEGI